MERKKTREMSSFGLRLSKNFGQFYAIWERALDPLDETKERPGLDLNQQVKTVSF